MGERKMGLGMTEERNSIRTKVQENLVLQNQRTGVEIFWNGHKIEGC
jgi:hypothetical protein